jgi:hypothetical protein
LVLLDHANMCGFRGIVGVATDMRLEGLQGHVRVGVDTVTDPAFLVTRSMEDFVTWVDTSKIRRHVLKYNDRLDDYDLLV